MKKFHYLVTISILLFYSSLNAQWLQSGLDGTYVRTINLSGTNLFVGTSGDGIFRSTNEGTNWTPVNTGLTNLYVNAFTVSGTNLFSGTEGNGVFRSTNNGASWSATSALTDPYVYALANSGTNLFAGADGGGVYLSTNNGTSWTQVSSGLTNTRIRALTISGTNFFTGTFGGGVFLSTNNGTSWTPASTGLTNTYVNAITVSGTNLFASTEGGIFLSTNNGTTWTAASGGLTNTYTHAIADFGTNLFAGTEDGVFLSTNNGTNWAQVSTGLTNTVIWALAVSGTYLFAGSNGNGVWRRPLDQIIPVELISFTAFVSGNSVTLRWTTATELNNLGFEVQRSIENKDWNAIVFVGGKGTTTSSQNYSCVDNSVSLGKYFYRLKQIDFDGSFSFSDVIEVDLSVPTDFVLEQNYPNPFNPTTTIDFLIVKAEFVSLKVYNLLGNEVATLVNEEKSAGKYTINFNAASLSSGTYFYKIQAGSFIDTKKMIFLK
jgi:hypothetical protein